MDSGWTLFHMRSPLNTVTGSGQYGELTKASSRKLTFSMDAPDELAFDMPGNHPQTALIEPLVDDVLVFRGDDPVQRFRVVTRALSKDTGVLRASFTAVSYRALLDAWIFHDTDTRSWPVATEQTDIAWTVITQGQARANGNLGITRGTIPKTSVTRQLIGSVEEGGTRPEYFLSGMSRGEAVGNVAGMINGFEWDIEPDPGDPYRGLKFNTWNVGGRSAHDPRSPLILDDGGSLTSWSHTVTPTDYGNVIRFTGAETTTENAAGAAPVPILPAWVPASRNPVVPVPEGRWERDINNSDLTTQAAVRAYAPAAYDEAKVYVPEIGCTLRRGRWQGPTHLWVGDRARLIITEPVADGSGNYVLYVDEDVRVVQVDVDVDEQGAEDVSFALNRARYSTRRNSRQIHDRLTRLERR